MYQHLLVPIDGSELSERAARHGIGLAAKLGARITAFVVEPMPPLPTVTEVMSVYTREAEAHRQRTEGHARETLARFGEQAAAAGVPFEGHFARAGDVDEAIAEAAARYGCDLVVMATHGRGAFGELLFGSHTKGVLSRSKLPLLVLQ